MNIKVQRLNNISYLDSQKIYHFLRDNPQGNFFQSPQFYNLNFNTEEYECDYFIAEDENKIIHGVLLAVIHKEIGFYQGLISSRCIVYGGPVVREGNLKVTDLLLKELVKTSKNKSIYIEFRNLFDLSKSNGVFKLNGLEYEEHLNYLITIDNRLNLNTRIKRDKKRQIRRSIERGVELGVAKNPDEIKEFYKILEMVYLEKVKKPLPSVSFFENFFKDKLGVILLVKNKDKIIAGSVCPIWDNKVIYDWYRAGLDDEYKDLFPSTISVWSILSYALDHNLKKFDFLGAGKPNENYGVRKFKAQFGGELTNYGRFLRVNNKLLYFIGWTGIRLYSLLKSKYV